MQWLRNVVQGAVSLLAVLGGCVAVVNLPMFTGCDFYAQCPAQAQAPARPPTQQAALPDALAAHSAEK